MSGHHPWPPPSKKPRPLNGLVAYWRKDDGANTSVEICADELEAALAGRNQLLLAIARELDAGGSMREREMARRLRVEVETDASTAHNQRWLDLADELEQEADDGERDDYGRELTEREKMLEWHGYDPEEDVSFLSNNQIRRMWWAYRNLRDSSHD